MLLGNGYRFDPDSFPSSLSPSQKEARQLFLGRIHAKDRYISVDKCPFCGASGFIKISERDARGLPAEISVCESCGGCFKSRILDPEANGFHYENISYILRGKDRSSEAVEKLFNKRVREFAYPRYSFIRHFVNLEPGKDLIAEFGCGDGANLVPWKREGFRVLGIEYDPGMTGFGRSKGLEIAQGDFMTRDTGDMKPKLIIMSHLLEHVSDVNKVLERIHSVLDPGGCLFIEVPGVRGQGLGKPLSLFDAEHNYYFDLESLSGALERNRFRIIYGDEYIRALSRPVSAPPMNFRHRNSGKHDLLDLMREAESGSIRIKLMNRMNGMYFKAYYSMLSAGAIHDKA
ncbi:MAG: class I SAM-dependent methyltransferase [Dehalococcoidales bacterium]|jgi:SAM-dependent methyltransferase